MVEDQEIQENVVVEMSGDERYLVEDDMDNPMRMVMDDLDALESPFKTPPSLFMCATQQLELGFGHFAHFDHFFQTQS